MKNLTLFLFLLLSFVLTSCGGNSITIKVLQTNEKAVVVNPDNMYVIGDTINVFFDGSQDKWKIDKFWIKTEYNQISTSHQIFYKARVIQ